jgi:hypothetical protein
MAKLYLDRLVVALVGVPEYFFANVERQIFHTTAFCLVTMANEHKQFGAQYGIGL